METMKPRQARITRKTRETSIDLLLKVDGQGQASLKTGLPFLDHMLDCMCRQALFDLDIRAKGDLKVDDHHLVEDLGLALGEALSKALGDKKGIRRYGWATAPLDEARVEAALDLSGRPYLSYGLEAPTKRIKDFDVQLMEEFTRALCDRGRITLHLKQAAGKNMHHILEAAFKALGLALRLACEPDPRRRDVASTKGTLTQ
jgi:imidazoleglycerol-phosphate dehydratase